MTAKVGGSGDTLKLAYDLVSEAAAVEYNHKPFKVVLGTKVGRNNTSIAKPTVSLVFENTYDL